MLGQRKHFMRVYEIMLILFAIHPPPHIKRLGIRQYIKLTLSVIPLLFILVPCAVRFVLSIGTVDIKTLTDMIYTICMFLCLSLAYLIIAFRQIKVRDLIAEAEVTVNQSMSMNFRFVLCSCVRALNSLFCFSLFVLRRKRRRRHREFL